MAEILKNTGAKLWSMVDDHDELQTNVFDQLFGTGGKSDIRLIDEAIGKINESLNGYYFKIINDKLYICKDTESGTTSLPLSITDDDGHVALKVDGTSITIDGNGVVHGATVDDAFSLTSENAIQNKVVKAKFDEVDGKINANETTISLHKNDQNNPHSVTKEQVGLGNVEDKSSETIRGEITKDNVTTALGYTPYTPNEVDNKFSTLETNIDWKEAVNTFDDIATTYPNPEDGWTVNTKDNNITYRYNGSEWVAISANTIPKATNEVDGLMTKEYAKKLDGLTKYTPDGTTITADEDGTLHGVAKITVDTALSSTSTNPVQNKVVNSNLNNLKCGEVAGGKNLLNPIWKTSSNNGVNFINNGDGSFTIKGTVVNTELSSYSKSILIPVEVGKSYKLTGKCIRAYKKDNIHAIVGNDLTTSECTFTATEDAVNICLYVRANVDNINITSKYMLTEAANESEYEPYIPSVKMLSEEKVDKSETTVNIFNPTLETTATNGIECTYNGDGTYTLNGTAHDDDNIVLGILPPDNKKYKITGCPANGGSDTVLLDVSNYVDVANKDVGNGAYIRLYGDRQFKVQISIKKNYTCHNLVFKPMLTTNLSATYDDFVPYTGDTGRLNGDVAELNKTVDTLKKSVSDGKTKVANAITDKGVETATDATFDVMAENISKIETGGGELHGATLAVSTEESTLFGQTVTLTLNGASVGSTVFADNGTCSFVVQNPGTYTITCGEAHNDVTVTGDNVLNKTVISVNLLLLKIVTFADGTDEEIAKMIQAHYNDKINIADYWAVGDTRNVALSAMNATGVNESHRAQTVQFVIGDFNHDDLTTPINGHTKAAVTLLQKDCLMDASNASNPVNGSGNTENGYMNSTNTNAGGWKSCARRTWCNNVFFAALPSVWQSMVKTVNKKSGTGGGSSSRTEITADKIFLASEIEIFGSRSYSVDGEGTQYQYYKNATANRYKMPKWNSSNPSNIYWERSPSSGYTDDFCIVGSDGGASSNTANNAFGVAPCLCI